MDNSSFQSFEEYDIRSNQDQEWNQSFDSNISASTSRSEDLLRTIIGLEQMYFEQKDKSDKYEKLSCDLIKIVAALQMQLISKEQKDSANNMIKGNRIQSIVPQDQPTIQTLSNTSQPRREPQNPLNNQNTQHTTSTHFNVNASLFVPRRSLYQWLDTKHQVEEEEVKEEIEDEDNKQEDDDEEYQEEYDDEYDEEEDDEQYFQIDKKYRRFEKKY
eukprot:403331940